jgi:hypothetical protein
VKGVVRSVDVVAVDCEDGRVAAGAVTDCVVVTFVVGADDAVGGEVTRVVVCCTPKWLESEARRRGPLIGSHFFVVDPLDVAVAVEQLRCLFEAAEASTWELLRRKVSRIGRGPADGFYDEIREAVTSKS